MHDLTFLSLLRIVRYNLHRQIEFYKVILIWPFRHGDAVNISHVHRVESLLDKLIAKFSVFDLGPSLSLSTL